MINFTLHEHDIKAFARRVLELPLTQGTAYKKIKLISNVGIFFLLLAIYLHWSVGCQTSSRFFLYVAIYTLSLLLIFMPYIIKNYVVPKQTLNIYKKVFANHQNGVEYFAKADDNSLYFKTPRSESTLKWGPELRLFEDDKYALLFIDPQQALIINRAQVTGDLEAFLSVVKRNLDKFKN